MTEGEGREGGREGEVREGGSTYIQEATEERREETVNLKQGGILYFEPSEIKRTHPFEAFPIAGMLQQVHLLHHL